MLVLVCVGIFWYVRALFGYCHTNIEPHKLPFSAQPTVACQPSRCGLPVVVPRCRLPRCCQGAACLPRAKSTSSCVSPRWLPVSTWNPTSSPLCVPVALAPGGPPTVVKWEMVNLEKHQKINDTDDEIFIVCIFFFCICAFTWFFKHNNIVGFFCITFSCI